MELQEALLGFRTININNKNSIIKALLRGYNLIDATDSIQKNQTIINQAIDEVINNSNKTKDNFIIESKIFNDDIEKEDAIKAVHLLRKKLKSIKLDLVLIHRPSINFLKTIRAFNDLLFCQKQGLIKEIGVCNFDKDMINLLHLQTGKYPAVNQIEFNPFNQRWDRVQFCQNKNITVQAYNPFGNACNNELLIKEAKQYNCSVEHLILVWLNYNNIQPILKYSEGTDLPDDLKLKKIKLRQKTIQLINGLNIYENSQSETY